jgi:hypothetical protein
MKERDGKGRPSEYIHTRMNVHKDIGKRIERKEEDFEEASSDIGSVKTNAVHLQYKKKCLEKKLKILKNKINHHK